MPYSEPIESILVTDPTSMFIYFGSILALVAATISVRHKRHLFTAGLYCIASLAAVTATQWLWFSREYLTPEPWAAIYLATYLCLIKLHRRTKCRAIGNMAAPLLLAGGMCIAHSFTVLMIPREQLGPLNFVWSTSVHLISMTPAFYIWKAGRR